jgi:RND family efflux transporter MFP subunit
MSSVRQALCLAALLAAPACSKNTDAKKEMPPARGEGAPPLPDLPTPEPASRPAVQPSEGKTTGTLYAHAEAQLGPAASGVISRVHVTEGDRVKKGQVVFQLDARDALLRKQQAAAALEAAKVNLKATQVEFDRTKALFEQNAVVRAQWDQMQARLEAAQVGVKQGEAALAMAQKGVADATVRSPLDGIVTAKLKSEGEMATMMPPTIVAIIQDQDTLDLRFRLPEKALATVKAGSTVKARFDALGVTHDATVTRIQPTIDPRTRTIEVVAELPNPNLALKPGLLAEVELKP